jgi:hypothetical protein
VKIIVCCRSGSSGPIMDSEIWVGNESCTLIPLNS